MNYIYIRLTTNVLQGLRGHLSQFYNFYFTFNIFSKNSFIWVLFRQRCIPNLEEGSFCTQNALS